MLLCPVFPRAMHAAPQTDRIADGCAVLTQEISVVVTVQIWTGPQKLAKPSRPRGEKHSADELQFKELVN